MTVPARTEQAWTPAEVRAWVERHGGNASALARRLRVTRQKLQAWASGSASARTLPGYVQAHMETLDRYELPPAPTP